MSHDPFNKIDPFNKMDMELVELATAKCDGVLTDAQFRRLTEILRENPQARENYVELMVLHALLAAKQVSPLEQHAEEMLSPQFSQEIESSQPSVTSTSYVSLASTDSHRQERKRAPLRYLRALVDDFVQQPLAAVLLCGAIVAAALVAWQMPRGQQGHVARDTQDAEKRGNQADQQQRDANKNDAQKQRMQQPVIARLGSTHNAEWGTQRAARDWSAGEALQYGDRLVLKRGMAEIVYHTSATVLLEGPAELELGGTRQGATHNACSLTLGKLVARVPEAAHGFTVVTPTLTIIDKGTEFGVLVKREETNGNTNDEKSVPQPSVTEVQVIEGRVVVEQPTSLPEPQQAIPPPDQVVQTLPKQIELNAGEGVISEPGGETKKTTDATSTTFVRSLPGKTPLLPLADWPADSPLKPGDIVAVSNASKFHLFKIDPATGEQTLLSTGLRYLQVPNDHGMRWCSVAVERDGHVLVGVNGLGAKHAGVLRIDPRSGAIKVLARGGMLEQGNINGLAVAANGTIYATYEAMRHNEKDHVLTISPSNGELTLLARFGDDATSICLDTNGHGLLLTSSKASLAELIDAKVTPWKLDAKLGRFDAVVVNREGRIFVGAGLEQQDGQTREIVYEVNRDSPHAVKTLAEMPNTKNLHSFVSMACEADGNLIVGPGGEKREVYRIDVDTGKLSVVSSGGMIASHMFLAVVPSRVAAVGKEGK